MVFIPFAGSLHGVKRATIAAALISSPYPVRIGYDVDAIDCGTLAELENMTAAWGSDAVAVGLSNQLLTFRFGEKIGNFNGRRTGSPAKLGVFEWFAASGFDTVWHLEDDCLVPDMAALAQIHPPGAPTAEPRTKASPRLALGSPCSAPGLDR